MFVKAGLTDAFVRADPCCAGEVASVVEDSLRHVQGQSSREFPGRKLGELRKFGDVIPWGAWLTSVAIQIPTSQRFMISWDSRLLSQSLNYHRVRCRFRRRCFLGL